jgi:pilus assembly protein FimV
MESAPSMPEAIIDSAALDFDIGGSPAPSSAPSEMDQVDATVIGLDFNLPDIGHPAPPASAELPQAAELGADLDFDIGFDSTAASPIDFNDQPAAEAAAANVLDIGMADDHEMDFDISLTESTVLGQPMQEPSFDMSSISLDLGEPELVSAPQVPASDRAELTTFEDSQMRTVVEPDFSIDQVSTVVNADFSTAQLETVVSPQLGADLDRAPDFDISPNEEVATKMDLAKAYEEMGDLEGARELLQEVLKEGDAAQQEKAQALLARIGA